MNATDLTELRALLEAATPGPWWVHDANDCDIWWGDRAAVRAVDQDCRALRPLMTDDEIEAVWKRAGTVIGSDVGKASDAALIAAAVTALPDLLDRLEAVEAECHTCADHARVQALIERSSLGSAEAKAVRESVPREVGIAIARAAEYLGRAKAAEAAVERAKVEALREAADDAEASEVTGLEQTRPGLVAIWLRKRADRIGGE